MDIYTVYCTTEQTKKALKLGAPIATHWSIMTNDWINIIPITEQMINWLEEQEGIRSVEVTETFGWHYRIKKKYDDVDDWIQGSCQTRKEATLAAIDAALDYLSNNNLKK